MLRAALVDPAPAKLDDEPCIATGYDGELDAERRLGADARQALPGLQLDWAQRYGVAALKIRHHAQLGYVLEVPAASVERLRAFPELTLRQGMANGARFTTDELSTLDQRIAGAAERAAARQRVVFAALVGAVTAEAASLTACADALALADVLLSAASLARGGTWCRPTVTDDTDFVIKGGRHPVVEAALSGTSRFVANDCDLSPDRRVLLLTGPNMAGKSTFLRQNALAVILAQVGLPIPAASARIGVVDRLFSRVGAADDLARGRSTFMVEMTETAAILNGGGPRSMVVVDEIGRGTATLDGLAIAWAVLEALHTQLRCRTIFATHFHELARLSNEMPNLSPYAMRVKEWKGDVIFLHEITEGAAGRSWGVHVARLAGVPAPTVRRAAALLTSLEKRGAALTDGSALPLFAPLEAAPAAAPPVEDGTSVVDGAARVRPGPYESARGAGISLQIEIPPSWAGTAGLATIRIMLTPSPLPDRPEDAAAELDALLACQVVAAAGGHDGHAMIEAATIPAAPLAGLIPRDAALGVFRRHLARIQTHVRDGFEQGRLNGEPAARLLAALTDGLIAALYRYAISDGVRGAPERLTIIATGGHGRGMLAPFSDIDLLFLTESEPRRQHADGRRVHAVSAVGPGIEGRARNALGRSVPDGGLGRCHHPHDPARQPMPRRRPEALRRFRRAVQGGLRRRWFPAIHCRQADRTQRASSTLW